MAGITLIGHNLPHTDAMVRNAAFSDLFFNHEHDAWDAAKAAFDATDESLRLGLKTDAEEFIATLAMCTGYSLDADELVEDFIARV